MEHTSHGIL